MARKTKADGRRRTASGGFLEGLTDLLEKLGDLAETGRELRQSGEFSSPDERVRGVYGFNMRVGVGGRPVEVKPFGNVKFDKRSKQAVVQEVREPLVDVIEEAERILVIAEMPGITADDVSLQIHDDVMGIEAHRGTKRYRTEVLLPKPIHDAARSISCNNGIVQIDCRVK